jgi:hypothetical protein
VVTAVVTRSGARLLVGLLAAGRLLPGQGLRGCWSSRSAPETSRSYGGKPPIASPNWVRGERGAAWAGRGHQPRSRGVEFASPQWRGQRGLRPLRTSCRAASPVGLRLLCVADKVGPKRLVGSLGG